MLRPGGYTISEFFDGGKRERDTITCGHHNGVVVVEPGQVDPKELYFCHQCAKYICIQCADEMMKTLQCTTFERRLEIMEKRDRSLRRLLGDYR